MGRDQKSKNHKLPSNFREALKHSHSRIHTVFAMLGLLLYSDGRTEKSASQT